MFPTNLLLKALPYIAAVLIVVGAYTVGHIKGTATCEIKNASAQATAVVKGDENHDRIESKVMALPDAALRQRLSRWMRD